MYSGFPALSIDFLSAQTLDSGVNSRLTAPHYHNYNNILDSYNAFTTCKPSPTLERRSLDSVCSPDNSITGNSDDGNESRILEVHSPLTSTASGGEEVESPVLQRYNRKVVKGPNGTSLKKPSQNYIQIISTAIFGDKQQKVQLHEIYDFFEKKYPYFKHAKSASWKNSVRHNLSLNECFIKCGRADNGKGHFWTVHPACVSDFKKGDFRRRQARRRARRGAFQQTAAISTNAMHIKPFGISNTETPESHHHNMFDLTNQIPSPHQHINAYNSGYMPLSRFQGYTGLPYYSNFSNQYSGCYSNKTVNGNSHIYPSSYQLSEVTGTITEGLNNTSYLQSFHPGHSYSNTNMNSSSRAPFYHNTDSSLKCKDITSPNHNNYTNITATAGLSTVIQPNLNTSDLVHSRLYTNIASKSREVMGADGVRGTTKGIY